MRPFSISLALLTIIIWSVAGCDTIGEGLPDNDRDIDGILDAVDNCPDNHNPGQEDANGDGIGDACDADTSPAQPVPEPPPQLLDGAYGGPVVVRTSSTINGVGPPENIISGYRIIEIIDGAIHTDRRALDKNGPFSCWAIEPGSQRTNSSFLAGGANQVQTIIETTLLGYTFTNSLTLDGELPFTGEGRADGTVQDGEIVWDEHTSISGLVSGQPAIFIKQTNGTLHRLGDNGAMPQANGMNGIWRLLYDSGGFDAIEVRGLRVTLYGDINGAQGVSVSSPVSSSTSPGDGVFISFEARTLFESDPVIRNYEITFRGEVAADGNIAGETSFVAAGKNPIVLTTTLERAMSPDC